MDTLIIPIPACSLRVPENTYDTVGPKESAAAGDHVVMAMNPAYGVCTGKQ